MIDFDRILLFVVVVAFARVVFRVLGGDASPAGGRGTGGIRACADFWGVGDHAFAWEGGVAGREEGRGHPLSGGGATGGSAEQIPDGRKCQFTTTA